MIQSFFSKNLTHKLAEAAVPARWVAAVFTPICILVHWYDPMSNLWINGLTVVGTLLGIYGVWLTLEIFRIGENFSHQQGKLIEEVHRSVMTGLKVQHSHELRRKFQDAKDRKDDHARAYWHFIWRFETNDFLGLSLKTGGYVRVRILGCNNKAMETEVELLELPLYTVEILKVQKNTELKTGRAYCQCVNGKTYISNSANSIDLLSPIVEFEISSIGPTRVGSIGDRPLNYKRLKDLKDPSSGDEDQG